MPLPTSPKPLALLAVVGVAALLGACRSERAATTGSLYPIDYRARHPIVLTDGVRSLDVFVTGTEHGLWQVTWNGTSWSWHFVGGVITSDPGAVSSSANHIDVFVRGTEGGLWQTSWSGTSGSRAEGAWGVSLRPGRSAWIELSR